MPSAEIANAGIRLELRQIPSAELSDVEWEAFSRVGFSHHREILRASETSDERWYYINRCAAEFWSFISLKNHLRNNDYRAYGKLPNNFTLTIPNAKQASLAVQSFKDEYLLDYVHVENPEDYDEEDVRSGIVNNVKKFIMSAGSGFCYIGDQVRLIVGDVEFFVDMLFFHRDLLCLVAFELKKGAFTPSDLGQLNFYLSALDKYVKRPHENKSIGILLCKDANKAVVELAVQDYNKPIGVATYRIGNEMPEEYQALKPIIDGVQQILLESDSAEDGGIGSHGDV
jgi:predicted nuclease of restriction endonuclease-like (RecB) superfamily